MQRLLHERIHNKSDVQQLDHHQRAGQDVGHRARQVGLGAGIKERGVHGADAHAQHVADDPLHALEPQDLLGGGKAGIHVLLQRHEAADQGEGAQKKHRDPVGQSDAQVRSDQDAVEIGQGHGHHGAVAHSQAQGGHQGEEDQEQGLNQNQHGHPALRPGVICHELHRNHAQDVQPARLDANHQQKSPGQRIVVNISVRHDLVHHPGNCTAGFLLLLLLLRLLLLCIHGLGHHESCQPQNTGVDREDDEPNSGVIHQLQVLHHISQDRSPQQVAHGVQDGLGLVSRHTAT
mmetsp:Transcript_108354/g.258571  ORF Transcript_108354/g.258571 Transcript_108354/m.258571 type:complete len:290 (-) Transcript_108354:87-956(-)